ncbi:MAG TPA: hypothetical protein VF796_18265 [Humisphaera sp.]
MGRRLFNVAAVFSLLFCGVTVLHQIASIHGFRLGSIRWSESPTRVTATGPGTFTEVAESGEVDGSGFGRVRWTTYYGPYEVLGDAPVRLWWIPFWPVTALCGSLGVAWAALWVRRAVSARRGDAGRGFPLDWGKSS